MSRPFQVTREETARFSKVWTKNGLAFLIPDIGIDFATDYANIVLNNFIDGCKRQAAAEEAKRMATRIVPGESR